MRRDNGAWLLIISVLMVKILGMLYKVPLSYILGDQGMGYFNTAYTIFGVLYIVFSTGIPKAVTMQISERTDCIEKQKILSLYLKGLTPIAALVTLTFIFLAHPMSLLLGEAKCSLPLLAIGPSVFFMIMGGVLRGYLIGTDKLGVIALSQLTEAVCKLVFGIAFAFLGQFLSLSLEAICALTICGISIGTVLCTAIMFIMAKCRKTYDKTGQECKRLTIELLIKMLKDALPITASSLAAGIGGLLDVGLFMRKLSINQSNALELYGNYSTLALPMFNLIVALTAPLTIRLLPKLCSSIADGNKVRYRREISDCINSSIFITSAAVAILTLYSFDILDILFSSQSSAQGYSMLTYLSLSLLLYVPLSIINTVHEANRRLWVPILSLVIGSLVKLLIAGPLVSSFGMDGVPLSTCFSYGISLLLSLLLSGDVLNNLRGLAPLFIYPLLGFISFYPPYKFLYSTGSMGRSFLSFICLILLSASIYIIISFFLLFCMNKKSFYRQNIQKNEVYKLN